MLLQIRIDLVAESFEQLVDALFRIDGIIGKRRVRLEIPLAVEAPEEIRFVNDPYRLADADQLVEKLDVLRVQAGWFVPWIR